MAKTKTEEIANALNIPGFKIQNIDKKHIYLQYIGDQFSPELPSAPTPNDLWEIEILSNRSAKLILARRMIGKVVASTTSELIDKISTSINKEIELFEESQSRINLHKELCKYLTENLDDCSVVNESYTKSRGACGIKYKQFKFTIEVGSDSRYAILKRQYSIASRGEIGANETQFDLSNPSVNELIVEEIKRSPK